MKLPRNIDAPYLIKALQKYGYQPTRPTGSHIRLSTWQNGQHYHHPKSRSFTIETLNAILSEVAQHIVVSKKVVIEGLV